MNIWIINHYYNSPEHPGGTRHHNLAKQLQQLGHDILICAANYNHFSNEFVAEGIDKTKKIQLVDGVPVAWLSTPAYKGNTLKRLWNTLCFSWQLLKIKKHLPSTVKQPDIMICSSPHLFAAFSGALLAKKNKVPFVLEIRDIWPDTLVELGKISNKHPMILIMKKIEIWLYNQATSIVTLLPQSVNYIKNYLVDSQKEVMWLPNFVDTQQVPAPKSPISSAEKKITVVYAGAHGLANGLDTALAAAKILQEKKSTKKIEFHFIGDGPHKKNLITYAKQHHLKNVKFSEAVAKSEIYSLLATADAYLMLLKDSPVFRWGISPNKLFDYMLMAKPIVFSVNTPFNPVAECQAGLTVEPERADLLAEAVEELYELSPLERYEMGIKGYHYVVQHHDVNSLALKLEQLLIRSTADSLEVSKCT